MRFAFLCALLVPSVAFADDKKDDLRVFLGGSGGYIQGSRMIGHGSRERFDAPSVSLIDMRVARVPHRIGVELGLSFMAPGVFQGGGDKKTYYGKLEAALDIKVFSWRAGDVVVGLGGGGDVGRYWWEGRGYPLLIVRERTWLSKKVFLDFRSETLPICATPHLPVFEQRFEMAMGIHFFSMGVRFSYAAAMGGEPYRVYAQHELGGFVGIGL